jgi:HlyD family secretion protein
MMEIGDTSHMMAEVEIWQDRIAAVSPGQPVEISADALGRSLYGRVETVGLKIGRQGLVSDDVAANADARVVRVLVALDAGSSRVAAAYTNLEAVARILGDPCAPVSQ